MSTGGEGSRDGSEFPLGNPGKRPLEVEDDGSNKRSFLFYPVQDNELTMEELYGVDSSLLQAHTQSTSPAPLPGVPPGPRFTFEDQDEYASGYFDQAGTFHPSTPHLNPHLPGGGSSKGKAKLIPSQHVLMQDLSLGSSINASLRSSSPSDLGDFESIDNPFIEHHEAYCSQTTNEGVYLSRSTVRIYAECRRRYLKDLNRNTLPEPFIVTNIFGDNVTIPIPLRRDFFTKPLHLRPVLIWTFNCDQTVGAALIMENVKSGKKNCDRMILPINVAWQPRISLTEYIFPLESFIERCTNFLSEGGFAQRLTQLLDTCAPNLQVKDLVTVGTGIVWHARAQRLIIAKGAKIAIAHLLAQRFGVEQAAFCWPEWLSSPTDHRLLNEMMEPLRPDQVHMEPEMDICDRISPNAFLISMSPHWPLRQWLTYLFPTRAQAPVAILCNKVDMIDTKYELCDLLECGKARKCGVFNCKDPSSRRLQRWIKKYYISYEFTTRDDTKHIFGDMSLYVRKQIKTNNNDLEVLQNTLADLGRETVYSTEEIEKVGKIIEQESGFETLQKTIESQEMLSLKDLAHPTMALRDFQLHNLYGVKIAPSIPKINPAVPYDPKWGIFRRNMEAWCYFEAVIPTKQALGATIRHHLGDTTHVNIRPIDIIYREEHRLKLYANRADNWFATTATNWALYQEASLKLQKLLHRFVKMLNFRNRITECFCFTYETVQNELSKGYEKSHVDSMNRVNALRYWFIRQILAPLTNSKKRKYSVKCLDDQEFPQRTVGTWKLDPDPNSSPAIPTTFVGPSWIVSEAELQIRRVSLGGARNDNTLKDVDYISGFAKLNRNLWQSAVFSFRPHQPVREILAEMIIQNDMEGPPLIICERVNMADELYQGCVAGNCPDKILQDGRFRCRDPNCKDPIDPLVQQVFGQKYVELGVIMEDDHSLGTLALYVDKDLL